MGNNKLDNKKNGRGDFYRCARLLTDQAGGLSGRRRAPKAYCVVPPLTALAAICAFTLAFRALGVM